MTNPGQVDLGASEKYWSGWYSGMSKLFLSVPAPKLLLLAGPDRLDTELTRAHMQVQTYKHTNIQTYKHTNIQTNTHINIQTYKHTINI